MTPITLDMSGADDKDFQPLDPGVYEVTVFGIEQKVGKTSGKPYLEFTFKMKDSERRIWSNYSLQPQSMWALKKVLVDAFGYDPEKLSGAEVEFEPKDLLGKPCKLVVSQGTYEGKPTNEVDSVLSPDAEGPAPTAEGAAAGSGTGASW